MLTELMIPFLLLLLWCWALAELESASDYAAIKAEEKINHGEGLRDRIIMTACIMGIMAGIWAKISGPEVFHWRLLLWIPIAWGAFTPVFRWRLNKKRGFHPCYVSPSSRYDTFFLRIYMGWGDMVAAWISDREDFYRTRVHRAGRLAYWTELSVLTLSSAAYIYSLFTP